MDDLKQVKELLDEINAAISSYDPVLKERARDLLLERAFGSAGRARRPAGDEGGDEAPRRRPGRPRGSGTGARRGPRGGMAMGSLLEQWTPETMAERALLGAYTLSRGRPERTVTSQAINAELKRAGLPVPNITRAIESNLRAKPPLMTQKKKMGTTRQARKQYAITQEGVEFVEGRLGGGAGEGEGGDEE
ncbi:MAG TPA: hypothetical protein VFQ45_14450 [Longimicrobium sp.]|nr:hypothetical protein [Longimicrobium sp.]